MKKICLISSAGGHLTEMLSVLPTLDDRPRFFVTFKSETTKMTLKSEKYYLVPDPRRNILKFIPLFFLSFKIFLQERPNIIISTGAGVVIPFCLIAKFFGKKLIFIESFSRTRRPSITGRVIYPFADVFLVQWKSICKFYGRKAKYVGPIL